MGLKSDHIGIEITLCSDVGTISGQLKSDHIGIEMMRAVHDELSMIY